MRRTEVIKRFPLNDVTRLQPFIFILFTFVIIIQISQSWYLASGFNCIHRIVVVVFKGLPGRIYKDLIAKIKDCTKDPPVQKYWTVIIIKQKKKEGFVNVSTSREPGGQRTF